MIRDHPRLVATGWMILVLAFITGMSVLASLLTGLLFTAANVHFPALLVQAINTLLGLLLTIGMVSGFVFYSRSRGWTPETNAFKPIIDAMERIAAGDFSIRLDSQSHENRMVSELAESVNKMALELDQMENLRQEFISNVSHEIQSPLTSIRGFAQALEDDRLSLEERRHYLSIIENESTRLSRITVDLLKLSSLESDHARFEPRLYRLDRQVRELILACEPQWREKDLDLDISLEEVEVTADEDLLSQVWTNLIQNSIKFTPPGGRVRVRLCRQAGQIDFTISDTGIGISKEDQGRVFERFYKADRSRTRSNGGSGLGLSIAKKIVEMHHGAIGVESEPGEGTRFTVSLPE